MLALFVFAPASLIAEAFFALNAAGARSSFARDLITALLAHRATHRIDTTGSHIAVPTPALVPVDAAGAGRFRWKLVAALLAQGGTHGVDASRSHVAAGLASALVTVDAAVEGNFDWDLVAAVLAQRGTNGVNTTVGHVALEALASARVAVNAAFCRRGCRGFRGKRAACFFTRGTGRVQFPDIAHAAGCNALSIDPLGHAVIDWPVFWDKRAAVRVDRGTPSRSLGKDFPIALCALGAGAPVTLYIATGRLRMDATVSSVGRAGRVGYLNAHAPVESGAVSFVVIYYARLRFWARGAGARREGGG